MIFFLLFFLLFSFFLAIKKPTYFVVLYLLVSTRFLGFLNIDLILINGYSVGFLLLNVISFIGTFTKRSVFKISKKLFIFILILSLLLLHGIFYSYYMGFSDVLKSIIAGNDFFYYFFLFYLLGRKSSIDAILILKFIKFLGLYLSIVLLINLLIGIAPPFYESKLFSFDSLEVYYLTYISLAMFIVYNELVSKQMKFNLFVLYISILFIGLIIGQHISIVITTTIGLLLLYVVGKQSKFNFKIFLRQVIIVISSLFIFLLSFSDLRIKIFNSIEQIISGTNVALISRDRANEFRWDAIKKEPVIGYGFIHPSSSIMKSIGSDLNSKYTIGLGSIDSGYVDLLLKFGYFGTIIMLILFGFFIIKVFIYLNKYTKLQVVMATYLLQYYALNYTWSVFSYAHGIIPLSLALFIILYPKNLVITVKARN